MTQQRLRLYALSVSLCALTCAAHAEPLTEQEALAAALSLPQHEALRDGLTARAEAQALNKTLWSNPVLSYDHQRLFDPEQGGGQDVLMISQVFDLSGTRQDRADSARAQGQAEAFSIDQRRALLEAVVRERFFDVLYAQARVEMHDQWLRALGAALKTVEARETAGDASRYERLRLESELARAHIALQQETITRDSAWDRLCALTQGLDTLQPWPRVQGSLLPDAQHPKTSDDALNQLPAFHELDALARAAASDAAAADRAWIPWLEVGAGYLHQGVGPLDLHGFALSVSLPLPFFSHGQDEAQRAAAQTDILHSQAALLRHEVSRDLQALHAEITRRRDLALKAQPLRAQAQALVSIAEGAYAGDELRLIELLEVHHHQLDVSLQNLELAWEARRVELALRRLITTGTTP